MDSPVERPPHRKEAEAKAAAEAKAEAERAEREKQEAEKAAKEAAQASVEVTQIHYNRSVSFFVLVYEACILSRYFLAFWGQAHGPRKGSTRACKSLGRRTDAILRPADTPLCTLHANTHAHSYGGASKLGEMLCCAQSDGTRSL